MTPLCRHCHRKEVIRPRGLCWTCYYTPGLKDHYPSTSMFARRGVGIDGRGQIPAEPTDAPPGSEDKIRVMEERAARGESLFHPDDRQSQTKAKQIKANLTRLAKIYKFHLVRNRGFAK